MNQTQQAHSGLVAPKLPSRCAEPPKPSLAGSSRASSSLEEALVFEPTMVARLKSVVEQLLSALASVEDQESFRAKLRHAEEALEREFPTGDRLKTSPIPRSGPGLAAWQMKKIKRHVEDNIQSRISVSKLAGLAGLSRCYFSRAFRLSFNDSPMEFIMRRRVERAQTLLLQSELSIAQIATDCGFVDQAHLCRCFGRLVGTPPSAWRRAQMKSRLSLGEMATLRPSPC